MPMPNGGRDIRLLRNPATGAFDTFDWDATGNPAFDDSDQHVVLSCVLERSYWANPRRQSTLQDIKEDVSGTQAAIQSAVEDSLKPALDDQLIRSTEVEVSRKGPGTYVPSVRYKSRAGRQETLRLPLGS
jgi:hypothetical protein